MGEVISEDVLGWARDLAAVQKLLAGEPLAATSGVGLVLRPGFGDAQARGNDPRLPRAPQSLPDSREALA